MTGGINTACSQGEVLPCPFCRLLRIYLKDIIFFFSKEAIMLRRTFVF
jgi:hypothetical protein